MVNDFDEIVSLLTNKVDRFGELHLDQRQTVVLLSWIKKIRLLIFEYEKSVKELQNIMNELKRK